MLGVARAGGELEMINSQPNNTDYDIAYIDNLDLIGGLTFFTSTICILDEAPLAGWAFKAGTLTGTALRYNIIFNKLLPITPIYFQLGQVINQWGTRLTQHFIKQSL